MKALARVVDFVLPPRCIVTGEMVDRQGMVSPSAWASLNFIADPQCGRCGFPFDFDSGDIQEGNTCGVCQKNPPVFHQARAALVYDDASRDIILGFKHGDQTHAVPSFLPWLMRAGEEMLEKADFLVPVPLHRWRIMRRRFNQSALMAQYLSQALHTPCLLGALTRVRATQTQGHLQVTERKRNVRNAFAVPAQYQGQIKDKNIVLIDDVYTTGATVSECAKALLKCGATSVDVLTLARVVKASRV